MKCPSGTKNILLMLLAVGATLALIEGGLRLADFPKEPLQPAKVFDPILIYKIPGDFPGVDADGFRNPNIPKQSDIVSLGDSHTYGYNVTREYTWPSYLARLTGLSNYNLGRGGYGPLQYYYLFDRALEFKPKYVVLGLFLGNDIKGVCEPYLKTTYWKDKAKQELLDLSYCDEISKGHENRRKNRHDKDTNFSKEITSFFWEQNWLIWSNPAFSS